MSVNVIRLRTERVEPVQKVKLLSNLFSNLLKQYRQKQNEIRQRKINFLFDEAYQYFYDLLETPKVADVDLPEFIYEEQRKRVAWEKASKALLDVLADGRLNECYSRRMKELRIFGRLTERSEGTPK